jgi:hypothetical protein
LTNRFGFSICSPNVFALSIFHNAPCYARKQLEIVAFPPGVYMFRAPLPAAALHPTATDALILAMLGVTQMAARDDFSA